MKKQSTPRAFEERSLEQVKTARDRSFGLTVLLSVLGGANVGYAINSFVTGDASANWATLVVLPVSIAVVTGSQILLVNRAHKELERRASERSQSLSS